MNTTANQPYKPLAAGDYIIVGRGEEYAGLVGRVKEIIRLGSPEHDTGNPTDDIVADLSAAPYSDRKKAEIVALAKKLGYKAGTFEDVPLDGVILAPDDIIRITAQEYEQYKPELMASLKSANKLGERLLGEHCDEMYAALIDRVTQNYGDYEREMVGGYSAQDVFDAAARIHAVSDAYSYLTVYHNFSEGELRFFLQFQNPLDMVAQHRHERNMDIGDMSFTMDFIMEPERQLRMLEMYSLVRETSEQAAAEPAETPKPPTLRERLCNKLSAEYDAFIADLKGKTPDEIIESAYEKVFKADIVYNFEYDETYSDKEIEVLLALENPLDELYHNWLDTDLSYMEDLSDSISGFVVREIERQNEPDGAASEQEAFQPIVEPPSQAKPKAQAASREPSLLDELHEAARDVEARKADRPMNPTKKYDKEIE